jgi:hypothetical protein
MIYPTPCYREISAFLSGEPLVAGKAFYERVSDLVELHNINKIRVTKAIQTNATLIDEKWCELFRRNSFHLGVRILYSEILSRAFTALEIRCV